MVRRSRCMERFSLAMPGRCLLPLVAAAVATAAAAEVGPEVQNQGGRWNQGGREASQAEPEGEIVSGRFARGSGPAESGPAESGLAESGLARSGPADSGLAGSVPAEAGPAESGPSGPEVETVSGKIIGRWNRGVREFLGVPFAAPPRRWLPPEPVAPWAPRTLMATQLAPGCIRTDTWYTLNPKMSEDCLYLNLWAPPKESMRHHKLAPVMVWIFGGGYQTGAGDSLQTRGDQLARTFGDVLVITFNYRLGVLGWLGSESLRRHTLARTGLNTTGNAGFLDQVEVLRWVKKHAAAFGGDPSNVLLFGESSGAGAVSAHLASPASRGLFQRAAMQSGGFNEWVAMTMDHATDNFNGMVKAMRSLRSRYARKPWARKFQCADGMSDIECLIESRIPGRHLVEIGSDLEFDYLHRSSDWDGLQTCQWGPIADGVTLLYHPFHSLLKGIWNAVPVLIGMNENDGTEFLDGCRNGEDEEGYPTCRMNYHLYDHLYSYFGNESEINDPRCFRDPLYRHWLALNWGPQSVDALFSLYNSTASGAFRTNYWAAERLTGDYVMRCTQRRAAEVMAGTANVFQYVFAHTPREAPFGEPPSRITDGFGACHGCEIPFVFNRVDSKVFGISGPAEEDLGLAMASYWTNFAWSGDPNKRGERWAPRLRLPARWPRVAAAGSAAGPGGPAALRLDVSATAAAARPAGAEDRGARCAAFWDPYFRSTGWFAAPVDGQARNRRLSWARWRHRLRHPDDNSSPPQRQRPDDDAGRWRVCAAGDAGDAGDERGEAPAQDGEMFV